MATNQFNIGKDISLTLVGPTGPLQSLGLLTDFESRPRTTIMQSLPINLGGVPVHRESYQGHEGSFVFDRQNGNGDVLAALLEANFFAGNPSIFFQINEVIRNPDGSTDSFVFLDCVIVPEETGKYSQNEKVTQRWKFECSQRIAA